MTITIEDIERAKDRLWEGSVLDDTVVKACVHPAIAARAKKEGLWNDETMYESEEQRL